MDVSRSESNAVEPMEGRPDLSDKVATLCSLLKSCGENCAPDDVEKLDEITGSLLTELGDLTSLEKFRLDSQETSKVEQSAVMIWNAAVTLGAGATFTPRQISAVRHIATGLLSLCYLDSEDDFVLKKQLMMALKTAKAWLECNCPEMAGAPLQLAMKRVVQLRKSEVVSNVKGNSEMAKDWFKTVVYTAEMAVSLDRMELAVENMKKAKELASQVPQEGPYLAMLCYNFGVKCFQEQRFEQCVNWLKESFDMSKIGSGCGNKNQARTLRLLASAYMEWDSEQHWQKALNAVELANSEFAHPAGLFLIIRVLLSSKTQQHRLTAALEELLRQPDLSVDVGVSVVKLLSDHDRKEEAERMLEKLSEKFENSLDLGQLKVSQLEVLLSHGQQEEAKKHVEHCITAHNTGKPLDVNIKKNFHVIFWEQAAEAYEGKDYAEALQWYNYSLSLYSQLERGTEEVAKLQRNRASCFIQMNETDKALESGREAEKCDARNPQTHFVLFKIALLKDDKDMALKALRDMSFHLQKSPGTDKSLASSDEMDAHSLICLAAQLAIEKSDKELVVLALENLLTGNPGQTQTLTALRCLTRIKLAQLEDPALNNRDLYVTEVLQYVKSAVRYLMGDGNVAEPLDAKRAASEAAWFMRIAWNVALQCERACKEMKELYLLCRQLSELGSDDMESLLRQKTCLLMAAAVSLQLARDQDSAPVQKLELEETLVCIEQCKKLLTCIQDQTITGSDSARDTSTPLLLTLYEFEARARLGDPRLEEVLEHALSLPATEPKAFHTLAALAMESPSNNKSLSIRALKIAIKKHLQADNADFEKCSKAFHSLIELSLARSTSDSTSKEETWSYYMDVLDVITNKAGDRFPKIEILWLMTKAWNCGIHFYSTSKMDQAARWCELGLRFLKFLSPSLKGNYDTQMANVYADVLAKLDDAGSRKTV